MTRQSSADASWYFHRPQSFSSVILPPTAATGFGLKWRPVIPPQQLPTEAKGETPGSVRANKYWRTLTQHTQRGNNASSGHLALRKMVWGKRWDLNSRLNDGKENKFGSSCRSQNVRSNATRLQGFWQCELNFCRTQIVCLYSRERSPESDKLTTSSTADLKVPSDAKLTFSYTL